MANYSFTFDGTRYPIRARTFWAIAVPLLLGALVWAGGLVYYGTQAVSYYTGLPGIVVVLLYTALLGSLTLSQGQAEREYTLLSARLKRILGLLTSVLLATYLVTVVDWAWWQAVLLCLPAWVAALARLRKRLQARR